ncbi:MAG: DUF952 domain-containing protein [Arcicella sp.]|jgi:uncharacterized protein (DUF952 family)|nr:DUF952 domain-containing protein [Arcicella sp.]
METTIYHLVLPEWWETFADKDYYESETLHEEKFIHLSTTEQVNDTLRKYFKGVENVVLLHVDTQKLTSELVFEDLFSLGIQFPHLYGRLNKDAIILVETLPAASEWINKISNKQ